ncbi:MAG: hypothetical protein M3X11_00945 [Acidobacteriota bacterium]|nr:hypothetical protein [Acidobacteriota bacterium]
MGSQNIVGWIVALLIGVAAGWLLSRQRGANGPYNLRAEKEVLDNRLRSYARDLEVARAELNSQSSTMNSLKSEIVNTSAELKSREIELGAMEDRVKALEPFEAEIESKKAEANALNTEINSLRARLAEATANTIVEPTAKKPTEPDADWIAELASLKQALSTKDGEITTLLRRVKELAPLKLQITDRDLRLRDWSSKYAEAIKTIQAKDEEIAILKAQFDKMDAALKQAEGKQANLPINATESNNDKVAELADRIAELESLLKAQTDYEAQIKELADQHEFTLGEKDSQLADLEGRLGEVDARLQSATAADTDQHGALRNKDAAISLLQLRVKELEPLGSELAERDAKLRRLEENFLLAHAAEQIGVEKDAEIARLQARIIELETSSAPTMPLSSLTAPIAPTADDTRLHELEALFQAALAEKDVELAEKTAELVRLQTLVGTSGSDIRARANADEAKVQELEAEHSAEISDRDAEIARLNTHIRELEPLHAQLFARDARLSELEARAQALASEKEREANRFNARIAELAPAGERVEFAEAKLRELEQQHQSMLNNKEVEISGLRVKLAGLENVKEQLEERLSKLRDAEI